jgi:hypothetical protein
MEGGYERWRLIEAEPLGHGRYRVLGLAGSRGAPGAGASRGGAPVEGLPRDEATSAVDAGSAEGTVIRCERRWLTGGGSRLVAVELLSADGSLVPRG